MEQKIDASLLEQPITLIKWPSVHPTALPTSGTVSHSQRYLVPTSPSLAVQQIANALLGATSPLLITSYLGRNHQALPALVTLSRILALPVFLTCPSAINLPTSHPYLVGLSYLFAGTQTPLLKSADVVLVVDAEVAWIPMNKDKDGVYERPSETAQIYVIDGGDPLRRGIGMHHVESDLVCHADAAVALTQLREAIGTRPANEWSKRTEQIQKIHRDWKAQLLAPESFPVAPPGSGRPPAYTTPQIVSTLRKAIGARGIARERALVLNESISSYPVVWSHMLPEIAGEIIASGGSALGWALGAGIGSVLGGRVAKQGKANTGYELVTAIVGDGTFLFGVPASAFWMASRYQTVSTPPRPSRPSLMPGDVTLAFPDHRAQQRWLEIAKDVHAWGSSDRPWLRRCWRPAYSRVWSGLSGLLPDCGSGVERVGMGPEDQCRPCDGGQECGGIVAGDDCGGGARRCRGQTVCSGGLCVGEHLVCARELLPAGGKDRDVSIKLEFACVCIVVVRSARTSRHVTCFNRSTSLFPCGEASSYELPPSQQSMKQWFLLFTCAVPSTTDG